VRHPPRTDDQGIIMADSTDDTAGTPMAHSAVSDRVRDLARQLTVDECADLMTGLGMWDGRPVERLGIPSLVVTDGPNGARGGGLMGTGTPTACIPAGAVLGATWDPALVERLGELLGDETRAKGAHVLLAPTINLHRNPLGGRAFECYSEDPFLTGRLAVGFVRGVQSRGVATTPKHLVANDSEFERNTIDVQVDERTLREVYLLPFEHAVREGEAWGVMSSYNRINGTYASEHEWLLTTVLRDEWGFDGFVVSDWFAVRSTAESVRAGLTWEMPGEGRFYGRERLRAALDAGEIDEGHLLALATDLLVAFERTGALDGVGGGAETELDRPADRALIREAAAAGTILLRNDGVLPLDPTAVASIAVIGPNARAGRIMGGGSAGVRPYRSVSAYDAIVERFGGTADVRFAQGCDIDRSTPPLAAPVLDGPMTVELFEGHDRAGEPAATTTSSAAAFTFFGAPAPEVPAGAWSARATGTFTPEVSGVHALRLIQAGRCRVLVDDEVIIDAREGDFGSGDDFFGFASAEIEGTVELTAGATTRLVIEYDNRGAVLLAGMKLGIVATEERDLLGEAVEAAAAADVAVVVVGTNDDWETEGRDRDLFELPGDQPELIRRVAAANERTVVVLNTGGPHGLDWLDEPAAVLSIGFAGQELGHALVDVLVGDADPGGRMPTTIPVRYEHTPSLLNYPGENGVVRYGEGLYVGHRFFDARAIEPRVPFGHGLSYTTFSWSWARVLGAVDGAVAAGTGAQDGAAGVVVVEVDVTNTGDRSGSDVVQLYVEPHDPELSRPVRELRGFAKVHLAPGETATARIELDTRSFAYYDPADPDYAALASAAPVPAKGGGLHRSEPGWYVDPGTFTLVVARSATDHVERIDVTHPGAGPLG
jgi:beta-glucosidase